MSLSHPEQTNDPSSPIGPAVPDWSLPKHPKHEAMEGRYCRLEPLDPGQHAAALFVAFAADEHGENWTYLPYGPFPSFEEFDHWLQSVAANDDPQFYTVIPHRTGEPAGVASFLRIDPRNGSIEVGHIHMAEDIKRSPVTTEAMFLMMKRAFLLGYRRYEWKCDALNVPSRSAATRLGLSFEGIFRQATVYKGRNRDTAWFATIDSEWPGLEQAFKKWLAPANFDESGRQLLSLRDLTAPILVPSAVQ
jgi:RimJ/RimL family protein N-acetyltransferase